MAANLVPKGVTDPEVRLFLQRISNTPYIATLVVDATWTTAQTLDAIVAKLNEIIQVNNSTIK